MRIENLSKEIDMTAVHGGSADSLVWIPTYNSVAQGNYNADGGNMGPVSIDNNNTASESTTVRVPTNYGLIFKF